MDTDGPDAMHKHSHKGAEYRRVEVITGQKRRRDWTAEEKAEIVAATMAPGATVTKVARRFDVSRALLWTWRRKAMAELAAEMGPRFVPLRIQPRPDATTVLQMLPRWIDDYNQNHPHSGLQMRSPREFIQCHSQPAQCPV